MNVTSARYKNVAKMFMRRKIHSAMFFEQGHFCFVLFLMSNAECKHMQCLSVVFTRNFHRAPFICNLILHHYGQV